MHLTQEQVEPYYEVDGVSRSTTHAPEPYVAPVTRQSSMATVITEDVHKKIMENKHADMIELVNALHYVFM
jgi:hypothetical protein